MHARLIVETGAAAPQLLDLSLKENIRLGRNSKNDLVLDDPHASRWHAEVYCDGQRWYVRDSGTTNGTKINGIKIHGTAPLENNYVIGIGDIRLRFTLDSSTAGTAELPIFAEAPQAEQHEPRATPSSSDFSQTIFHADELTALLQFMTASLAETTPHDLVNLALTTLLRQTLSNVAGFLSQDTDEPQFRLVQPAQAQVNTQLSRQLTQRVEGEKRTVWLGANRHRLLESDSLMGFRDAVAVPLRVGRAWARTGGDAGARTTGGARAPPPRGAGVPAGRGRILGHPARLQEQSFVQRARGTILRSVGRLPGRDPPRASRPPRSGGR